MKVASFYRFLDLAEPKAFRDELQSFCDTHEVLGTILVAAEGFNGTICGSEEAVLEMFQWIRQRLALETPIEARWTEADEAPFRRMRVRVKKEIVTLGRPDILPHRQTGTYVPPEEWNSLIDDPDVLVIDTRNHYEFEVGSFPRAVDPAPTVSGSSRSSRSNWRRRRETVRSPCSVPAASAARKRRR